MQKKLFSILALLLIAVTGATAQTTYSVTVKDGTVDADKWTATPNPATAGQTVTVKYNGTKKVKSVKAVKKAAEPAATTVTIPQSDFSDENQNGDGKYYFTKDGVTVTADDDIDDKAETLVGPGSFSTTLGNFTQIVVTAVYCDATSGEGHLDGWSVAVPAGGNLYSQTWAGTPASTVSFDGAFMGGGYGITIVCTIEPKSN